MTTAIWHAAEWIGRVAYGGPSEHMCGGLRIDG